MKNTIFSFVFIAIIVLLNGCSPDESKWKNVVMLNTVDSYSAYLKEFQSGVHKAEAEQLIEKIEWKTAFTEKNEQKLLTCINKYKNSSNVKVAEEMLWSIKWPAVKIDKANSVTICKGGSRKSMGELVFSMPAGSAMLNFEGPGGKNKIYIWRDFSKKESNLEVKIGLRPGIAYLLADDGSFKFVKKVDLKLSDDELAREFGLDVQKR